MQTYFWSKIRKIVSSPFSILRYVPPLDSANPLYCILKWYIDTTYVSGKLGPGGGKHTSKLKMVMTLFLAHLSRRLIGELIVYQWSGVRRPSVVRRRRPQCSNIFFSETAWLIKAKFYVEPPWVGGTYCVRGIWVT